jgi:predicted component of type VI protein secretion system
VVDAVWDVHVRPAAGDGYLTEFDVDGVCDGVPDGEPVTVLISDFEAFAPAAAGLLARRLALAEVTLRIEPSARRVGSHFRDMFDRAHDQYVAVETELLHGRPA